MPSVLDAVPLPVNVVTTPAESTLRILLLSKSGMKSSPASVAMDGMRGSLNRTAVPVADPAPDGSLPLDVLPSQYST